MLILNMSSWLKTNEAYELETNETPVSNSLESATNDGSAAVESSHRSEERINEELLHTIEGVYSPLLKVMKLFGAYFGETTFECLVQASGRCKMQCFFARFYCGVVVAGLWFNFTMPMVSMFFEDTLYLFILYGMWTLMAALNGTICLIVLPLTDTRQSRFEKFLRNVIKIHKIANLEKVKYKARKYLIMFSLFIVPAIAGVVFNELLGEGLGKPLPWKMWFIFTVSSALFLAFGCIFWVLPIIFFCITCDVLESLFDDLQKRMPSMNLTELRNEHQRLCEVVELADKVLSPILLMIVAVYMPFLCFCSYFLTHISKGKLAFVMADVVWLLTSSALLAAIMLFGSKVNEKVHIFQKILQKCPVSKEDEGKLLMFILDLQGEPKGLSIGGMVVITKSLFLTIVGVIASYIAVMLSLPK